MATLPNRTQQPIALDTLLARATAPKRPSDRPVALRPAPRTLADLERSSSLATARTAEPRALVLCITRSTCECGSVYEAPNNAVLVRYDEHGFSNSVHYRRGDATQFAGLTRERKVLETTVPFCDKCF